MQKTVQSDSFVCRIIEALYDLMKSELKNVVLL